MKHKAEPPPVTTGPVVIVERSADLAEMLHMFFRLMELEPVILPLARDLPALVDTIVGLAPAAVIVDLSAADLPSLELARALRARRAALPVVLLTDAEPPPPGFPTARVPSGDFEELLAVMEAVLG
jgi:DNA-binding NtrC family response regulator